MGEALATQPRCFPRTTEAKYLRSLGISPDDGPEAMARAAESFNKAFVRQHVKAEDMPRLIAEAQGEAPIRGEQRQKPRYKRPIFRLRTR